MDRVTRLGDASGATVSDLSPLSADQRASASEGPRGARTAAHANRFRGPLALGIAVIALFYGAINLYAWGPFVDTRVYWLPWSAPIYTPGLNLWMPHFVYSPAVALALRPLALLPLPVFAALWTALGVATYAWLLHPLPPIPRAAALLAGCTFALNGNIEWALALMVVLGMRRAPFWLVAAFTKVLPFLGFAWFVLLRDWRAVAQTAAIGATLLLVSAALLPGEWVTWARMLASFTGQAGGAGVLLPSVPLVPRLAFAAVLLVWGAMRRQPLVLPLVLIAAQPDLQPWALGYLAAVPRLYGTWREGPSARAAGLPQPVEPA